MEVEVEVVVEAEREREIGNRALDTWSLATFGKASEINSFLWRITFN